MPKSDYTSGNPYVTAFHDLMATSKDFIQFLADPAERQGIRQGFTDAVNRGAIAATLGAPVDMANTALNLGKAAVGYLGNKAGVLSANRMPQLIDNPVGGSEYIGNQMRRFGVVSPNRNALAEGLAGFLPTSPTTSAKAVAAIGAGGVVPGMDLAATVFHGSPHKCDRFDSSKIGTGEGAQAYGHGLYLADSPAVAGGYKDRLSNDYVKPDGGLEHYGDAWNRAFDAVQSVKLLPQDHARAIASQVQTWVDSGKQAKTFLRYNEPPAGYEDSYAAAVNSFSGLRKNPGQFYKVNLPDEAIAKMLDWDKPLSQQAPEVRAALSRLIEPPHTSLPPGYKVQEIRALSEALGSPQFRPFVPGGDPMTMQTFGGSDAATNYALNQLNEFRAKPTDLGRSLYNSISRNAADASAALRQAGIPGIRYLDGGSRSAGAGSSNYVIFPGNESLLSILERNGPIYRDPMGDTLADTIR